MVLMSNSVKDLQQSLNDLHKYCNRWGLKVNIDKTKVMVFLRRWGRLKNNGQWILTEIAMKTCI